MKWTESRKKKPSANHSVLMLTSHGIAEGEWQGDKWLQYRWQCILKDSEVSHWMELNDLNELL